MLKNNKIIKHKSNKESSYGWNFIVIDYLNSHIIQLDNIEITQEIKFMGYQSEIYNKTIKCLRGGILFSKSKSINDLKLLFKIDHDHLIAYPANNNLDILNNITYGEYIFDNEVNILVMKGEIKMLENQPDILPSYYEYNDDHIIDSMINNILNGCSIEDVIKGNEKLYIRYSHGFDRLIEITNMNYNNYIDWQSKLLDIMESDKNKNTFILYLSNVQNNYPNIYEIYNKKHPNSGITLNFVQHNASTENQRITPINNSPKNLIDLCHIIKHKSHIYHIPIVKYIFCNINLFDNTPNQIDNHFNIIYDFLQMIHNKINYYIDSGIHKITLDDNIKILITIKEYNSNRNTTIIETYNFMIDIKNITGRFQKYHPLVTYIIKNKKLTKIKFVKSIIQY